MIPMGEAKRRKQLGLPSRHSSPRQPSRDEVMSTEWTDAPDPHSFTDGTVIALAIDGAPTEQAWRDLYIQSLGTFVGALNHVAPAHLRGQFRWKAEPAQPPNEDPPTLAVRIHCYVVPALTMLEMEFVSTTFEMWSDSIKRQRGRS